MLFGRYLIRNRNLTESPNSTLLDFQVVPKTENHNVLIPNKYLNNRIVTNYKASKNQQSNTLTPK